MVEIAISTIYAYTLSYEVKKQAKSWNLVENLADRRKMEIACKIPLKPQICCKK